MNRGLGCSLAERDQDPCQKPPRHTPILPPILTLSLQLSPSPCTLTRTTTGFNIAWNGGNVIASKYEKKELELEKKPCKESVSIGTAHALEILGESTCVHPFALCVREAGRACQSRQVKASFVQGTLSPPTRACHHHHSTRTSNDPPENHPDHGASSP